MKETMLQAVAAVGGAVLSFFCGMPPVMWVLVAVMSLDYLTGIICGIMGVSEKTEHGHLASSAAFRGLMKKVLIIIVVLLAALLDKAVSMGAGVEFAAVTGATCLWFIASEGISVLENVVKMGVPVPEILTRALELMKNKGESGGHGGGDGHQDPPEAVL